MMRRVALGIILVLLFCAAACGGGAEPTIVPLATSTLTPTTSATGTVAPTATHVLGSETIVYIVKPGDTLGAIADEFGTTVEAIVEANDLKDPDFIKEGQELIIPQH